MSNQIISSQGKVRKTIIIIVLLSIFFFGVFLWWFAGKKSVGVIRNPVVSIPPVTGGNDAKTLYQGKYISFSHRADYEEVSHFVPEKGIVKESILLSSQGLKSRKIAVSITARESADLRNDPSYQVRENDSLHFTKHAFAEPNFRGVSFTSTKAPFESTAFFFYEGQIVSISVNSFLQAENLETELQEILASIDFSLLP